MAERHVIKIDGLREFQASLKAAEDGLQKQLRITLNSVAETVAGGARRRVPVRSGRAKGTVRVLSTQREARVAGGGRRAPYYPWLDFGGSVGRGRTGRGGVDSARGRADFGTAGSVHRPFVTKGRYIYPTYFANRDSIQRGLERALSDLAKRSGFEVEGGAG